MTKLQLPNFFIVGAPKAGSTSLYNYLNAHPEIFMSPIKEPNFFSYKEIEEQKLYYKTKNIKDIESYMKLFIDAKPNQKIGEASVSYLFYPTVPVKIKKMIPEAKIIILLRDPVKRAFSHYLMDKRLGYVKLPFEDIVFKKISHKFIDLYHQQYITLGFYYEQVKRYFDVFGRPNVCVILTKDMDNNIYSVFKEICLFLEIPFIDNFEFKKFNVYTEPSGKLLKILFASSFMRELLKKIIPNENVRERIKSKFFKKSKKPQLSNNVREFLIKLYKDDIKKLEELILKDLTDWYT